MAMLNNQRVMSLHLLDPNPNTIAWSQWNVEKFPTKKAMGFVLGGV